MRRSRTLLVAGIVGAVLLVSAAPALAQAAAGQAPSGIVGGICRGVGSAAGAVADLLGMQPTAIAAERQQGKSLAEIAKDKGISQDELVGTILAAREAALTQAVADGRLTQAQADAMLAQMKSSITTRVQSGATGGLGNCNGAGATGAGCGMRGGAGFVYGAGATSSTTS